MHENVVRLLFDRVRDIMGEPEAELNFMRREKSKDNRRYIAGYINLKTKLIVLDIYTPKTMKPKSMNGMIRVLAHEFAHIQKMPYRQFHRGRWIIRQHYPAFYKQVEKNIDKIKKDPALSVHFKL
jgi:hypothetical protein